MHADSLLVHDAIARRLSVFTSEGRFARDFTVHVPSGANGIIPLGVLAPGGLVARELKGSQSQPGRIVRSPATGVHHYALTGERVGTIVEAPGSEVWTPQNVGGGGVAGVVPELPFRRTAQVTTAGDHVILAMNDTYELRVFDARGRLVRIIRRAYEPVPVTAADRRAFIDAKLAAVAARLRPQYERTWEDAPVARTMPAYGRVIASAPGSLWVEESQPMSAADVRWTVFDPGGRAIAVARTPLHFDITDIGSDWVLGTLKDELDVEHVRLYDLRPAR